MATPPLEGPERPQIVRTSDVRFSDLPGYSFEPHYRDLSNPYGAAPLRMHFVDEGPRDAPVVLMAHGEPTWSYLYRKLVPVFAAAGLRAIAPDHIGFGRSDKLTLSAHYSFDQHISWLQELVMALDLRDITLVCQDWGGPVSLGVLAREPERFSRAVVANSMLHTTEAELAGRIVLSNHSTTGPDQVVGGFLLDWMMSSHRTIDFSASAAVAGAVARGVTPEIAAAYDAPFPSEWHKAGMRQFPVLIPVHRNDPGAAINLGIWQALRRFDRPFLTLFSDSDPSTSGWEDIFQERVPGAKGQPHKIQQQAGHFWQEDCGDEAAAYIVDWISKTPV